MAEVAIRPLAPDDAPECDAIIASLPYFFGDPDGVRDCAEAVRTQRGFAAVVDGRVRAFLTLEGTQPGSIEITWMAAEAAYRRRGLGARLIEAAATAARADGVRMLFVLTLGASVPEPGVDDSYAGTRAFYRANGFIPLRELGLSTWNDGWGLILARPL